jgi:hypothetical protein
MNRSGSRLFQAFIRQIVLATIVFTLCAGAFAQVFVSVRIGPPALPVYAQPICPGPGYMWTPGYWAWSDDAGYYWVPGTWVVAPVGLLWTPGWWGWGGGLYLWHPGYWGPHVGFYGGINYGFGYTGVGFAGGEWHGRDFYYNRSVTNVSVTNVTNVYNKTVIVNNTTVNNVSYNGGTGGVQARPTAQEQMAEHEQHTPMLAAQTQHQTLASQNRQNFASENHGRPAIAATARAGDFSSRSAIPARAAGAAYHPPAMSPKEARGPAVAGNRGPASNSNPSPQERSNNGFRPFTPPSSNNSNRATGGSNANSQNRPSSGFHSFTPPNSNNANRGAANNSNGGRPNSNPPHANPAPQANHGGGGQQHRSSPPPRQNQQKEEPHRSR